MADVLHMVTRAECKASNPGGLICAGGTHTDDPGYVDPFQPFKAMSAITYWYNTTTWATLNEGDIEISAMGDRHLANTIAMIRRIDTPGTRWKLAMHLPFPMFNGDMAQMCAESEYEQAMEDLTIRGLVGMPLFRALVREHTKRQVSAKRARDRMPKLADW